MAENFELQINKWMEDLLDRSKRNQLLYFRPSKSASLRIVEESPAEIFGAFDRDGEKTAFLAVGEVGNEPSGAGRHLRTELRAAELERWLLTAARKSSEFSTDYGINALFLALGFLEWRESANSDEFFRAPLVLVPVRLERVGVAKRHTLAAAEEKAFFNPALELACRREHKIAMPEFASDTDDFDLRDFYTKIAETIGWLPGWRLLDDVYLSMFTCDEYVIYKDLDDHRYMFHENGLVRALCGTAESLKPPDIMPDAGVFDRGISPDRVYQVLDADSIQQEAVEAVKRGACMVIRGAPGSGKSQTITNIISESMAAGRKVLLVSEKPVCLKVVRKRLEACGLGEFCLELQSGKSDVGEVTAELERALALAGEQPKAADTDALMKLNVIRDTLNSYPALLHEQREPLGYSVYKVFGRLAAVSDARDVKAEFPDISVVTYEDYLSVRKDIGRLSEALASVGTQEKNPWIGVKSYDIAKQQQQTIINDIKALLAIIPALKKDAAALTALGAPPGDTFPQLREMKNISALILESPHPGRKQISDPRWAEQSVQIAEVISLGRKQKEKRRLSAAMFNSSVFSSNPEALAETFDRMGKNSLRFMAPSFWAARRLLRALYKDAEPRPFAQAAEDLRGVSEAMQGDVYLRTNDAYMKELFGSLWEGIHSDWDRMSKYAGWMESFQRAAGAHPGKAAFENLCVEGIDEPQLFADAVNALDARVVQFFAAWKKFAGDAKFDPAEGLGMRFVDAPLDALYEKLSLMDANPEELRDWLLLRNAVAVLEPTFAKGFVNKVIEARIGADAAKPAFERAFMKNWLAATLSGIQYLREFDAEKHEKYISEFVRLDAMQCGTAALRIRELCVSRIAALDTDPGVRDRLASAMRENGGKQGGKTLRSYIQENALAVLALKPCMMMTPSAVARYVDPEVMKFDLVIIDEAGCMTPGRSIGAIMRGKQVVVVGDDMQMPPADFSVRLSARDAAASEKIGNSPGSESILDHCEKVFSGKLVKTLKWHYRSRHESLIAFSNEEFYEGRLATFPSPSEGKGESGVKFVYVQDGVFDGDGSHANRVEARKVAEAVMSHAAAAPEKSLGVAALSAEQQEAILDELEILRKGNERYEDFFSEEKEFAFFVKNVENLQSCERDVMFISMGYGKDAAGIMRMEFKPFRRDGGEKRLNVLVTAARERVVVFSSIRSADIDSSSLKNAGDRLLKKYLEFAEAGGTYRRPVYSSSDAESTFEDAIYTELTKWGYTVHRKVGCSGHRIDLAVVDPAATGGYVIGIECDGESYGGYKTARDRDRLRGQVLTGLGWRVHRVWSSDWFNNPSKALLRLRRAVDEAIAGV